MAIDFDALFLEILGRQLSQYRVVDELMWIRVQSVIVSLFLSRTVFAAELPIVSSEQLKPGNYWTWSYYTGGDLSQFYSAERYKVISVRGSYVTFEIRSHYDPQSEFTPSARFRVNLTRCDRAFQNPKQKVNFLIDLYPYENGKWAKSPLDTPSTAFEEKFNCNPIIHKEKNSLYETRFETSESDHLFQQWPKSSQSQIRSFYYLDHPGLAGVASRKSFNPGTAGYYEMRLTDWGKE